MPIVTVVSLLQPEKASRPISVTESGIRIPVSPVQPLKASWPISVTESGMTVVEHPAINLLLAVWMMALQLSRES